MSKFGYTINHDRQTDYDKLSRKLNIELLKVEPSFEICIQCGSCTATCTAAQHTEFNPRNIFLQIKRGTTQTIRNQISKCMLCGKCRLVCPRGVNNRNIMLQIRILFQKDNSL